MVHVYVQQNVINDDDVHSYLFDYCL